MEYKWENLKKVLDEYGKNLVENYQRTLADEGIDASGDLSRTTTYKVNTKKKGIISIDLKLNEYWKYVENGRKAGKWPPISAIEKWIEVKQVLPRPMDNGKLPTTQQLAFLISRKIKEEGILPRPVLQKSIDNANTAFWDVIEEAIAKDLDIAVEVIFKEEGF